MFSPPIIVCRESAAAESARAGQGWKKGSLRCRSAAIVPAGNTQRLALNDCPHCSTPFFVPRRIRDYFLVEPAGGGGMGSVYKAVSVKYPDRVPAVKVLARKERMNLPNIHAILNEALVSYAFKDSQFVAACPDSGLLMTSTSLSWNTLMESDWTSALSA